MKTELKYCPFCHASGGDIIAANNEVECTVCGATHTYDMWQGRPSEASKADAGEVVDNEWFFRWAARAMADGRYQEAISTIFYHPANPYADNNPWADGIVKGGGE